MNWVEFQELWNIRKENKQLKVYESRYKELEERYLHGNEKHFGEILTLYFEDEPYPTKEGN